MQEHDEVTRSAYKFYMKRRHKDELLNNWFALSPQQQINNVQQLKQTYPNKTPIILLVNDDRCSINNPKLMFPSDISCAGLKYIIRKKTNSTDAHKSSALFIYTLKNKLVPDNITIKQLVAESNYNGILYLKVASEDVFG